MTTTTNAKNLRYYESKFSLIVEQILAFASNTNLHNDALRYRLFSFG